MFKPLRNLVLLRRVREERKVGKGLLVLPDASRQSWNEYVVVRAGKECVAVKPGDRVWADKLVGVPVTEVEVLGEEGLGPREGVRIAKETELLAHMEM